MNQSLAIRICIILLIVIASMLFWNMLMKASDGMKLVGFILMGAILAIVVVKFVLPWLGDSMGEAMFSSGEKQEQDEMMKAAACISQGDYAGAIEHYEKMLAEKPEDPFPVAEIAKLHAEKLHDPQAALNVLSMHLQSHEWPVDDAAFLMFRIADVHQQHLHDFAAARDMLEQVVGNFSGTRHSANAHHKIGEIEQAEYKFAMEQRSKAAAAAASSAEG
jgi:tetratricopeptide (TPR) repeat protein